MDRVEKETFSVIEQVTSKMFDEMALKAVSSPILLVGAEFKSQLQKSRPSSRESKVEPKRAITNFLRRIAKQKPISQITLSNMSTNPQESQNHTSHNFFDFDNPN